MQTYNLAIAVVVAVAVLITALMSRARKKLTAEQLYAYEQSRTLTGWRMAPIVPMVLGTLAVPRIVHGQLPVYATCVAAACVLFAYSALRARRRHQAIGLPPAFVRRAYLSSWLALAAFVASTALIAATVRWR